MYVDMAYLLSFVQAGYLAYPSEQFLLASYLPFFTFDYLQSFQQMTDMAL